MDILTNTPSSMKLVGYSFLFDSSANRQPIVPSPIIGNKNELGITHMHRTIVMVIVENESVSIGTHEIF